MTTVDVRAEIGFQSFATDPIANWADVTPFLDSVNSKRGRSYELDRIESGTATIVLDNADGRFTPGADYVPLLSEYFGELSGPVTGAGLTTKFGAASGIWEADNTAADAGGGATVTPLAGGGVRVSGKLVGTNNFKVAKAARPGPGVTFRVTAEVRVWVENGTAGGSFTRLRMYHRNAAGNTLGTFVDGPVVVSGGQWVKVQSTFTTPTLAAQPTYADTRVTVAGFASGTLDEGKTFNLEVRSVRVEVTAPYAGNIKPRRPVRVYGLADDNWLPAESVDPSQGDGVRPRWTLFGTGAEVLAVFTPDFGGKYVWRFAGGPGVRYDAGVGGYSDATHVKAGDIVVASADIWNEAGGGSPSITIWFEDGKTAGTLTPSVGVPEVAEWQHREVAFTAPADGVVRFGVSADVSCQVANPKLRLNAVGSEVVSLPSGVFPVFRGHVERWRQEYDGLLSTVTLECVDPSTVLSGPIPSSYRMAVQEWTETHKVPIARPGGGEVSAWVGYWPGVESADSRQASPMLGGLPLLVRNCINGVADNETAGFTSNKTMVNADGETSGGFTVTGTEFTRGSVLQLTTGGNPPVGAPQTLTVDLWYSRDDVSHFHTLWQAFTSGGGIHSWVYVVEDGTVFAQTYDGNGGVMLANSGTFKLSQGAVYHVGARFGIGSRGQTPFIEVYVNGVTVASNSTAARGLLPSPAIGRAHFGRYNQISDGRTGYVDVPKGTINHLVAGFNLPPGLHQELDTYGWDRATGNEVDRLNRVLDGINWAGSRNLDPPLSDLLSPRWGNGEDGYGVAASSAEDAGGTLFVGAAGEVTYHNRHRRIGVAPRWTVAEWNPGMLFELDDERVYNSVTAERSTGLQRTAEDADSIREYGRKSLRIHRDAVDPDEVQAAASWTLHRYGEAAPRCDTLHVEAHTLNGNTDVRLLTMAIGVAISDRLMLVELPPSAPSDEIDSFVEGIDVDIRRNGSVWEWRTTLSVSDAHRSDGWVLENDTTGVLGADGCVVIY
ncbi:hypothetical protein [Micromonospora avicenniae]|uniref:hypothetical protein n=1 Tax=Micromonospora avicenniae TaxID=1198245 RepID=UPI00331A30CF